MYVRARHVIFCVTLNLPHFDSHNTFASGGSDGTVSIWDHNAKKRMKQYPHFPTEVSCLSFSPDGEKLAIGVSYEHDNGVAKAEDMGKTALLIKTTVMDDCRVSAFFNSPYLNRADVLGSPTRM